MVKLKTAEYARRGVKKRNREVSQQDGDENGGDTIVPSLADFAI